MLVSKLLVFLFGRLSFGAAPLSAREAYHTHVCSSIPARNAAAVSRLRGVRKVLLLSGLFKRGVHDIVAIMATRRHSRSVILFLMAAFLIFPPLTSVLADGLGIDLAHHHCDSHGHDAVAQAADTLDSENHGAAETDPFQCDQCHLVLAAVSYDMVITSGVLVPLPDPGVVRVLLSVRIPPAFKPPIA